MSNSGQINLNNLKKNPERSEDNNPNDIRNLGKSIGQGAVDAVSDLGGNFVDQLFGFDSQKHNGQAPTPDQIQNKYFEQNSPEFQSKSDGIANPEFSSFSGSFNLREQRERQQIQEVKAQIEKIKKEIKMIRETGDALAEGELSDIEKVTLESNPKAGLYHTSFLEIITKLLKLIYARLNESRTWLQHASTKKAKRGSAFAARSKKQGTQYSMSQEHQLVRQTG